MGRDLFVHQGLSEHGLIKLIMSESSIAYQVDDDIILVLLSVLSSILKCLHDIIKRISIHMEDRAIQGFCKIR